ncbi:MAG: hypothetical protein LJE59_13320 [Chromatiaceae bacterium]|nr:hypothetical protein [Chromatiaceae bacterium]
MYRSITALGLVACLAGAGLSVHTAWADETPQSIMFQGKDDRSDLTTLPAGQQSGKADRCAELSRRMEELKGKPQQRYSVSQQFEAECQRR